MGLIDKQTLLKKHYNGVFANNESVFDQMQAMGIFRTVDGVHYDSHFLPRPDNQFTSIFQKIKRELTAEANKKVETEKQRFNQKVAEEVVRQRERDARLLKKNVLTQLSKTLLDEDN